MGKNHLYRIVGFVFVIVSAPSYANTITDGLINLQQSLFDIWEFLMGACYLFGIMLFTLGMLKLKKYGQMTVFMMAQADIVGPIMRMLVGTLLIYTPFGIKIVLSTIWGTGTELSTLQGYGNAETQGSATEKLFWPVFTLVQVIGLVGFLRGTLLLTKTGEQSAGPGNVPRALILIFGGVMAINIVGTINVVRATFGYESISI